MHIAQSVIIDRPLAEVFALAGNPDYDPRWGGLIVESRQISEGSLGRGSQLEQIASLLGARFTTTVEITEYEPLQAVAFRTREPVRLAHCRTFEPVPGGTRVAFSVVVDTQGHFKLAGSLLRNIAQRRLEADLEGLKEVLEASTPSQA
jgi:hypothetical protein